MEKVEKIHYVEKGDKPAGMLGIKPLGKGRKMKNSAAPKAPGRRRR